MNKIEILNPSPIGTLDRKTSRYWKARLGITLKPSELQTIFSFLFSIRNRDRDKVFLHIILQQHDDTSREEECLFFHGVLDSYQSQLMPFDLHMDSDKGLLLCL